MEPTPTANVIARSRGSGPIRTYARIANHLSAELDEEITPGMGHALGPEQAHPAAQIRRERHRLPR
jgi:hypothetical protein